ncbi:hypothetical protein AA313_de0200076 [Arthrobotrys entomopaga]|nr:hypothetical protein AA313_de0200076 [Arthrobotrys entomopaga]
MAPITIHGRTWDPEVSVDLPSADESTDAFYPERAANAKETNFIVIQTKEPLSDEEHTWLLDHNVYILSRVDAETFLCKYEPEDLDEIRRREFINYADVYHTYWKFPPGLDLSKIARSKNTQEEDDKRKSAVTQTLHIIIQLHTSPQSSVQQLLQSLINQKLVDPEQTTVFSNRVETVVDACNIRAIADIDDVLAIDEAYEEHPHAAISRDLFNCPNDVLRLTDKGAEGVSFTLSGEGEVINIVDSHSYGPSYQDTQNSKPNPYDGRNSDVDTYLAAHPDLVVTWSAGNDGAFEPLAKSGQIGGRARSKNVITVGSTLSARRIDGKHFSPAANDADTFTMSPSSSRGPVDEQRIKPDICAPGCVILSAHSRLTNDKGDFGLSTDVNYKWSSGTSMAAPAVAGCAAILRQALRQRQISEPTGALIKALLVNGAIDIMREPDQPPQIPNNTQGFGRVNIQGSLHMIIVGTSTDSASSVTQLPHAGFFDVTDKHAAYKPISSGAKQHFPPLNIPGPSPLLTTISDTTSGSQESPESPLISSSLKVTLTWYDAPNMLLQDRLGLAVNAGNGERRHGNKGDKDMKDTPDDFDTVNNVQLVVWENVPSGELKFEVTCAALPGRKVNYALAWSLE